MGNLYSKSYTSTNEVYDESQGDMQFAEQKSHFIKKDMEIKKDSKGHYEATWEIFEDYESKTKKIGKNLKKIVDKDINIKGYMIPLDYSSKNIKEFLLVPYIPSCMHVPPPPENMIITVSLSKKVGVKASYFPIEVKGKLKHSKNTKYNDPYFPTGIFSLDASEVKEIEY